MISSPSCSCWHIYQKQQDFHTKHMPAFRDVFLLWFHTHPSEHGWMKWLEMWTTKLDPLRAPGWILVRGFHMHSLLPSCGLEVPSENSFRTRAGSFREHWCTVTDCGRLRRPGALGLSDRWYEWSSLFMNPREEAFQHEGTQPLVLIDRSQTSSGKYGCGYSVSDFILPFSEPFLQFSTSQLILSLSLHQDPHLTGKSRVWLRLLRWIIIPQIKLELLSIYVFKWYRSHLKSSKN